MPIYYVSIPYIITSRVFEVDDAKSPEEAKALGAKGDYPFKGWATYDTKPGDNVQIRIEEQTKLH